MGLHKIGIMQGRLLPPEEGRFQAFPRTRWVEEFSSAAAVPLACIEWIFDAYGEDVNPIATLEGRREMELLSDRYGLRVQSLCADWFMDYPFLRCSAQQFHERQEKLYDLIQKASSVGVSRIVLPFVDASRIDTRDEEDAVVNLLTQCVPVLDTFKMELHLETSLAPVAFSQLLARLPYAAIKVNYDSGNSSSLGYKPKEEFAAYGDRIGSVHIKDRVLGGSTVPLGTGGADFPSFFQGLRDIRYDGDFILQVARGTPGDEVPWAQENLSFVRRFWPI